MAVSLRDVADFCGLSLGTVSRALNGHPAVSSDTIDYVKKAALKLGYVPNRAGRALSANKNPVHIGVVMPNSIYFNDVQSGMLQATRELSDLGLTLSLERPAYWEEKAHAQTIDKLLDAGCNALCLCCPPSKLIEDKLSTLSQRSPAIPFGCVNHHSSHPDMQFFVGVDFYKSGRLAANLASLHFGQREIHALTVVGMLKLKGHRERQDGFKDELLRQHVNTHLDGIIESFDDDHHAYQEVKTALRQRTEINCLYVATGLAMEGTCRAIEDSGRQDIFVIGTDDMLEIRPFLVSGAVQATICQHPEQQGYQGIKMLYNYKVTSGMIPKENLILQPEVKLRAHFIA